MKTLQDVLKEKKIRGVANIQAFIRKQKYFKVGGRATTGQNYGPAGSKVTVDPGTTVTTEYLSGGVKQDGGYGNTIRYYNLVLADSELSVKSLKERQKEIASEVKKLNDEKRDVRDKLAFLKEAGVDSFTDTEYKAFMTLKTLEKEDLNDIQKAQAIAKLIDG
jgi:hypothetical protein